MTNKKTAIIIGAGPAGLTAAYELLTRTDIKPIILEMSADIGGISKTVRYKGNRIDIGGHRFFSKSDRVMDWWLQIMPIGAPAEQVRITYRRQQRILPVDSAVNKEEQPDLVMLIRDRLSRIYYQRKLFLYPLTMSMSTIAKLGLFRLFRIMVSYGYTRVFNHKKEKTLEDFFIKRFGKVLYKTFFKDYTEKVWGKPCHEIDAAWGHQRIKKLSVSKTIKHALQKLVASKSRDDIHQKETETSLIERFLYPKYGPGQLWEEVAARITAMGGEIHLLREVKGVILKDGRVTAVETATGRFEGDYFFSTMPVKDLVAAMDGQVPPPVKAIAAGLEYRDFVTVGLLLDKLVLEQHHGTVKDNWIYIQENDVKVGRLQIFNNWSPFMVSDPNLVWIGLEYFCNEGDELWSMDNQRFVNFGIDELQKIGIIRREHVRDSTVVRMKKTYPAYFGTYQQFDKLRAFTDTIENLFLVGRNGMHKYNNADHSMLTAMTAVDNIIQGITTKDNIWDINTEQEYHEEKQAV
ncbi:NAD(P)/FAD-dependent oxidoreductase [Chitinophaga qingshengii]|uniref:NAD(P)/FAD-dependent oxidoreductase n=1 Tax=Chitinophaga qingshengii TaxID=1569794 RepID=A0ABR7TUI3_9BACT|nr:NAD(P)/FAD-dependent oxidoreductase [Chitinophaga qingshengii]MBC9933059.1 NAD(P)/FAD-dependent oxidoreductase [Chitinophaga qingshengii]